VPAGTVLAQADVMGRHLRIIFDDPVGGQQFQQAFSEILDVTRAPVGAADGDRDGDGVGDVGKYSCDGRSRGRNHLMTHLHDRLMDFG